MTIARNSVNPLLNRSCRTMDFPPMDADRSGSLRPFPENIGAGNSGGHSLTPGHPDGRVDGERILIPPNPSENALAGSMDRTIASEERSTGLRPKSAPGSIRTSYQEGARTLLTGGKFSDDFRSVFRELPMRGKWVKTLGKRTLPKPQQAPCRTFLYEPLGFPSIIGKDRQEYVEK